MNQRTEKRTRTTAIAAAVCPACGALNYPAPLVCSCGAIRSQDRKPWDEEPLTGTARLLTWTRLSAVPHGFDRSQLTLGIVQFPNGVRAVVQLDSEEPRTGMNVDVAVEEADDGEYRHSLRFVSKEHAYA